jgi:predicted  nucleic acid-binding Zn-ribbon protein
LKRPTKTLAQLAIEAADASGCPKCHCRDFRKITADKEICRHCGRYVREARSGKEKND